MSGLIANGPLDRMVRRQEVAMCMEVEVDGKVCASQGELSAALGGPLVMDYGPQDNRLCLCPVHVGKTAANYGRKIESSDDNPWCVKMTPNVK